MTEEKPTKTYEFTIVFVGHGETRDKAWEAAKEGGDLEKIDPPSELIAVLCPVDEFDMDHPNGDETKWYCSECGYTCSIDEEDE